MHIKLFRKVQDSAIWQEKPFSPGQAWADLLLLAATEDAVVFKRNHSIPIKRGQLGVSILELSKRWGWSQGKLKRFLNLLKNEEQIEEQNTSLTTLITIINYDKYNGNGEQNGEQTENKRRTKSAQKPLLETPPKQPPKPSPEQELIDRVIAHLNQSAGKKFNSTVDANRKHIRARLREGYQERDFMAAIDNQCREWLGDERMEPYLRPTTLFNCEKFDNYVNNHQTKAVKQSALPFGLR